MSKTKKYYVVDVIIKGRTDKTLSVKYKERFMAVAAAEQFRKNATIEVTTVIRECYENN